MNGRATYHIARVHLIVFFAALYLLDYQFLLAQRSTTTLARVQILPSPRGAQHIYAVDASANRREELLLTGRDACWFKYADSTGWRTTSVPLRSPASSILPGRIRKNSRMSLLAISERRTEATLYRIMEKHRLRPEWTHEFDTPIDQAMIADITNDGRGDLLCFGKKQPGISIYPANAAGSFDRPTTILAEYSFSAVLVADFNNDGINDIAGVNWITNEVLVFTSFGKLKFTNPFKLELSGEPADVLAADFNRDGLTDLLVVSESQRSLSEFGNDGFGAFHERSTAVLDDTPHVCRIADLDGDGYPDVACLSGRTLMVLVNDGEGAIEDRVPFAAGLFPADFCIERTEAGISAGILDTTREELRILSPAADLPPGQTEDQYATGVDPGNVVAVDLNGEGVNELLVPNAGSRTVSLFFSSGTLPYKGQMALPITLPLDRLALARKTDSSMTIIGYRLNGDSIAVLSIRSKSYDHQVTLIPTQGTIDLLATEVDTPANRLSIITLEQSHGAQPPQVVEYRQITPSRFIERTYISLSKDTILAAAMIDVNGDSYPDLVYAAGHKGQQRISLSLARSRGNGEFLAPREIGSVDAAEVEGALIWVSDVTGDGRPDILFNVQDPVNSLYIFAGVNDSTFAAPLLQFPGDIRLQDRFDVQVLPKQPGRLRSVIINNSRTRSLQMYNVRQDGLFIPASRLVSTQGMGGFTYIPASHTQNGTLILTDRPGGYIRIMPIEHPR